MNRLLVVISLTLLVGCSSSGALRAPLSMKVAGEPFAEQVTARPVHSSSRTDVPRVAVIPGPRIDTNAHFRKLVLTGACLMTVQQPTVRPVDHMTALMNPPEPFYVHSDVLPMVDCRNPEYGRTLNLGRFLIAAVRYLTGNAR